MRHYAQFLYTLLYFGLISFAAHPSWACKPVAGEQYDTLLSQDIVIASSKVLSVTAEARDKGDACFTLNYSTLENFLGVAPSEFSVTTCVEDVYQMEALMEDEAADVYGFVPKAEVIVMLVRLDSVEPNFRYVIPSCWGPMHYRLDTLSEEELSEAVHSIKDAISNM